MQRRRDPTARPPATTPSSDSARTPPPPTSAPPTGSSLWSLTRSPKLLSRIEAEMAPRSLGEGSLGGRGGQEALPADPGGLLRAIGQGEAGNVRRGDVRSVRRRRPGFLRFYAGDARHDGQCEK